jgi:hypothetical protein
MGVLLEGSRDNETIISIRQKLKGSNTIFFEG